MGELYDTCQAVLRVIDQKGLDAFKTRGAIALETGFLISVIGPNEPDDPAKVAALKDAARKVLGVSV